MVNQVAVFAALGDRSRCRMVERLAATEATVSQLAQEAAISLPATLKHVRVLEQAGLVAATKQGRTVTVRLQPQTLADSEAWLHRTRTFWTARLDALAASFAPERPGLDDSDHHRPDEHDTDDDADADDTEDRE
ncbi:MAG: transcriptional regulator [Acidobacteria bacterium]|nr:MAG: transcriptional regulator [Acidobacteriota bacterium]